MGEPTRKPDGKVFLPVRCDVSGLTAITQRPTTMNSALIVWRISRRIERNDIYLAVKTGVYDKGSSSLCQDVMLGDLPPGSYQVYYQGSERVNHFLAEVKVSPLLPAGK